MRLPSPIRATLLAIEGRVLAKHKIRKIGEIYPKDVVVAAFPKSGNTWMQTIIAGLKYGVDASTAPDSLVQDLVPDLHYKSVIRRYSDSICFKSHHFPREDFRRVIHLVRDGRDVLVSYFHYRRALGFSGTINELMNETNPIYGNWAMHLRAWEENPYKAEKLVIRYEDLLFDSIGSLERISEFIGADLASSRIEEVSRWTTASRLQERERRSGWDNPHWPKDKSFIRRAISGSFHDELSDEMKALFGRQYGDDLRRFGYAVEEIAK